MRPTLAMLDHLVLTVADIGASRVFYTRVLGMRAEIFTPAGGSTRHPLTFGTQKIDLPPAQVSFEPKAPRTGATHPSLSIYPRGPDGTPIEIVTRLTAAVPLTSEICPPQPDQQQRAQNRADETRQRTHHAHQHPQDQSAD